MPRRAPASDRPQSLTDQVYEQLKWRILSLEFPPGEFLNELDVCARLGYGRGPVHHAFQRLKHDGLVDIRPRKGIVVRGWAPHEVTHLIEARQPIERAIVQLAAVRRSDGEVDALRHRLADGPALIEKRDRPGLIRLDRDFHAALARMARNPVLEETSERLHARSTFLWFADLTNLKVDAIVQRQHEAVLEAVARRDPEAAAAALDDHLSTFNKTEPV